MIYAVVVGAALYIVAISMKVFANQEGLQLILFFVAPFIAGIVGTGVKRSFLLTLVLSLIFAAVANYQSFEPALKDVNILAAVVIAFMLFPSLIGGALGAAGGFIGGKIFKKQTKT